MRLIIKKIHCILLKTLYGRYTIYRQTNCSYRTESLNKNNTILSYLYIKKCPMYIH